MALASPAARQKPHPGPRLVAKAAPELVPEIGWTPADRIAPGVYPAYSRAAKVYRDPQFQRWVCAVQFDVMDTSLLKTPARLTWFLNLGTGDKPHASKRGRYWAAWLAANGKPPARRDKLSRDVFIKRHATVRVADTKRVVYMKEKIRARDGKLVTTVGSKPAPDAAKYSIISEVLTWDTGAAE